MSLVKTVKSHLLTPTERRVLVEYATGGTSTTILSRSEYTTRAHMTSIYDKLEDELGVRPTIATVLLYVVFGRLLSKEDAEYLINSGELHSWQPNTEKRDTNESSETSNLST